MKRLFDFVGNMVASFAFAAIIASVFFLSYYFFEAIYNHAKEKAYQPTAHLPPDCDHLHDVGRHAEWAECMGVGYK